MVFTNKYTEALLNKFPDFYNSNSLKDEIALNCEEEVDIYTIFFGLTSYVINELINKHASVTQEELDIYKYVEQIRVRYSDASDDTDEFHLDNAACTCFLENLINTASFGTIEYSRFIPFLGEKSKEYCRAWDEFTGVKSPGLWENDSE